MGPAHFPDFRKNHLELLIGVVAALILSQSVRHGKLAERFPGTAQHTSVVLAQLRHLTGRAAIRRLERFFANHPLAQADTAALVLACLPPGKLTLILDRTNWRLGKSDLNVLVLGVQHRTVTIPLLWEWLPHGGGSAQSLHTDLLEDLFCVLCPARVGLLLGDREFIGEAWFATLWGWGVPFSIRVRDDTLLDGVPAGKFFADLPQDQAVLMDHTLECYGVPLTLAAVKSVQGERVVLASTLKSARILSVYRQRFRIECLFRHLKTKDFSPGGAVQAKTETHMTQHDKLDRLLGVVVIAYLWCVLLGVEVRAVLKVHGRRARAVFTEGLARLTRDLSQTGAPLESCLERLMALLPEHAHSSVVSWRDEHDTFAC